MKRTWRWEKRSEFGNKGQGTPAWTASIAPCGFSSRIVAEKVFEDYIASIKFLSNATSGWIA